MDLVSRLHKSPAKTCGHPSEDVLDPLFHEAADEIMRLRRALIYYADPESYDPGGGGGLPSVNKDRGALARETLYDSASESQP